MADFEILLQHFVSKLRNKRRVKKLIIREKNYDKKRETSKPHEAAKVCTNALSSKND